MRKKSAASSKPAKILSASSPATCTRTTSGTMMAFQCSRGRVYLCREKDRRRDDRGSHFCSYNLVTVTNRQATVQTIIVPTSNEELFRVEMTRFAD